MRRSLILFVTALIIISCASEKEKKGFQYESDSTPAETSVKVDTENESILPSEKVDLQSKGIGPFQKVKISNSIDNSMAQQGEGLFKIHCAACHKVDKKFIGSPMSGITNRRSPEWIMNFLVNTGEMLKNDPLAKDLLKEFKGVPMVTAPIKEEEARALYEYMRTLK